MVEHNSDSWKLTLPCTKEEAEALAADIAPLASLDPPPVLMTSEADSTQPDAWRLDAYFEAEPDAETIALIRALVPSAARSEPVIERLPDADWVTLSQSGLDPIRAGRFFVHTPAHAGAVPPDTIAFSIEAGQAFGTGHHETTTGCLLMLDRLHRAGARFDAVADIGTGTGLLAFAARALWPKAQVIASDIDPVAIAVTRENAEVNLIPVGRLRGKLELAVAPGLQHRRLVRRAPYDLLIANILAGPLIELAPSLSAAMAPGGSLILAGLLDHQAEKVAAAYRRQGLRLADRLDRGDWPTLRLVKRRERPNRRVATPAD
jgi:ribosomal protein L11 methyltransferase